MQWLIIVDAVLLACTAVACLLAHHAWRYRPARGSLYFSLMTVSLAVAAATVALELASHSLADKIFWSKLQYVGIVNIAPLWLLFAASYSQKDAWISRMTIAALWVIPVATLALVACNEWHGLAWPEIREVPGALSPDYAHGPVIWVFAAYSYTLVIIGAALLVSVTFKNAALYRGQRAAVVAAAIIPCVWNILYIASVPPFHRFELGPLASTASACLIAWSVFRLRILEVAPVAYETLIALMPEGVILIDEQRRIIDLNAAAQRLTGLNQDCLGQNSGRALAAWPRLAHHRDGTIEVEMTNGPGTESRWVESSATVLRDPRGRPVGTLLLLRDCTERRRAEAARRRLEARMLQAQKLESLGILAGGVAHDFNNLLMAILGNAELAMLRLPEGEPVNQMLESIASTVDQAAALSRQMLSFAGKGSFDVAAVDLNELIRAMTPSIEAVTGTQASVIFRLASRLPRVPADAAQIRQVIMNLVMNAFESLEGRAGSIALTTAVVEIDARGAAEGGYTGEIRSGRFAMIEVADNGCGIDAATLPRIFDPFFSTKLLGRGLGLAAALGIVRGHKGAIRVQSTPGKGTTVVVLLPTLNTVME